MAPKTGPRVLVGSARRAASVRLAAPASRAAATVGAAARIPIVAADPAYTPDSIGSTDRLTTCSPNRSATTAPTAGSEPPATAAAVRLGGNLRDRAVVDQPGHRRRRRRDAVDGVRRKRMQAALAVDRRANTGGADLPAGQAEFGQQRGHLGPAHHERLGADVHRLTAEPLGAQDAAEPIGRVEQGDGGVITDGNADPVGGHQSRNAAPDNAIRPVHSPVASLRAAALVTANAPGPPGRSAARGGSWAARRGRG